jgi:DNA-binding beta-propeller fold protein YncE
MNLRSLAVAAMSAGVLIASPRAQAPKPDPKTLAASGILERLAERSGVYAVPPAAKVPGFIADAGWPQKLPNNWIIGQVGGLYVAPDDHIWIYQRPRSLTNDEAALTGATHRDKDGKPVDALGFARPSGSSAYCCLPAPSIMEFDAGGALLRAWGGPADPDKCKASDGCVWPSSEHGIFVDHNGFVYIGGSNANAAPNGSAWSSARGADGMVLKFTKDGKFVKQFGFAYASAGSNDMWAFRQVAKVSIDDAANEAYVSDGYGNHRVAVLDMDTGKIKRYWGAYGNKPDDTPLGNYNPDAPLAQQFRNPVHCAEPSKDGMVYVCDRPNDRIQVFTKDGKFVKEVQVAKNTRGDGSVWDIAFSKDAAQKYFYLADGANEKIRVFDRQALTELTSFGDGGRQPGQFYAVHSIATDSKGNVYTTETYRGQRVQKFVYKGLAPVTKQNQGTVWPTRTTH